MTPPIPLSSSSSSSSPTIIHDNDIPKLTPQSALRLEIIARCPVTKARVSHLHLPHFTAHTPMFMPVGTQGTMKGLTPKQLEELDCHVILGNTYHLALRPGEELLNEVGGLHKFMNWKRGLLTDSGGFQMVSLVALSKVTEEGVEFLSPRDGTPMLLTPEKSIEMQNAIEADILMQLDDVVSSLVTGPRVEEAMWRSIRWLDRCINAHKKADRQNLFAIIQGGLDLNLRKQCLTEMIRRDTPGYAIGGLSGGEEKDVFWRIVTLCTDHLPEHKPRYCMGVGYAEDLVVCSALGVDMYDCVFPTRTARFGTALTMRGPMPLRKSHFIQDMRPIEDDCTCPACQNHTRSYIATLFQSKETAACHLISLHNIAFQMRLMRSIRTAIIEGRFPEFIKQWMFNFFKNRWPECKNVRSGGAGGDDADGEAGVERNIDEWENGYPLWVVNALRSVNIELI